VSSIGRTEYGLYKSAGMDALLEGFATRITKDFLDLVIEDGRHAGQTKLEFEQSKSCVGVSEHLSLRQAVDSPCNGDALPAPTRTPCGLYGVLSEVRIRKAKQEVDKIAGIGFIMSTDRDVTLPIFSETMDTEEAWTLIVRCMTTSMGDELLFRFPVPGHGDHGALWFPSWKQIFDARTTLPKDPAGSFLFNDWGGHCVSNGNICSYVGYFIAKAEISWPPGRKIGEELRGILKVKNEEFRISVSHLHPILPGTYSFVFRCNFTDVVVCAYDAENLPSGRFLDLQKISVICIEDCTESKLKKSEALIKPCRFF
jgi:hypothetical protein